MKFRLPDLGSNVVVASAKVKITVINENDPGVAIRTIRGLTEDDEWTQSTLTWNNKPSMGAELDETGPTVIGTTYVLDVTDDLQGRAAGTYSYGFRTTGTDRTAFASREHDTKSAARLTVKTIYRSFSSLSYWNKRIDSADISPNSAGVINYLKSTQGVDYIKLTGAPDRETQDYDGDYGRPMYFVKADQSTNPDPVYTIRRLDDANLPQTACNGIEFRETNDFPTTTIRIPAGAHPDGVDDGADGIPGTSDDDRISTNDAAMTVFDKSNDIAVGLNRACFYDGSWYAGGLDTYVLSSNGLHNYWNSPRLNPETGTQPSSAYGDAPSTNRGHRGAPSAQEGVRWAEYRRGGIPHALHLFVHKTHPTNFYFPMQATDGSSSSTCSGIPSPCVVAAQGMRLRLKSGQSLTACEPGARVILETLKRYGGVITDSSGNNTNIKVENLVSEGKKNLWRLGPDLTLGTSDDFPLERDDLSCGGAVDFDDFEVLDEGLMP